MQDKKTFVCRRSTGSKKPNVCIEKQLTTLFGSDNLTVYKGFAKNEPQKNEWSAF